MNKFFSIIKTTFAIILVLGMFLLFCYQQTHYVRVGHVIKTKSFCVDNYYDFVDSTGYVYEFVSTDLIDTEQVVKVKMFNNCTEEDVTDDIIIDYKIISKNEK